MHTNTPVYAVAANEGFCITGGAEGLVRIWPLDFADFLIEAKHDGPIRSLDILFKYFTLITNDFTSLLYQILYFQLFFHLFNLYTFIIIIFSFVMGCKLTIRKYIYRRITTCSWNRGSKYWNSRHPHS